MTLIEDAKVIWHKLWSVRLALLACAVSIGQAVMDAINSGQPRPAVIAAAIMAGASALARLIQQPAVTGDKASNG